MILDTARIDYSVGVRPICRHCGILQYHGGGISNAVLTFDFPTARDCHLPSHFGCPGRGGLGVSAGTHWNDVELGGEQVKQCLMRVAPN